jgi:hypothetical protein
MKTKNVISNHESETGISIKPLNKLGASFFALFLLGSFLPLFSDFFGESISLYETVDSKFLFVLAFAGIVVFLSGVSRIVARLTAGLFIGFIVFGAIAAVWDAYDYKEGIAELLVLLKEFAQVGAQAVANAMSPVAGISLLISFMGIACCIRAPRYKENLKLRDKLFGIKAENTASEITLETTPSEERHKTEQALPGSFWDVLLQKTKNIAAVIYRIGKPVLQAYLDKGTELLCKIFPNLNRDYVRHALLVILVFVVLYFVF